MLKAKYIRVLELLEKGGEIKLEGYRVVMNEDEQLCFIGTSGNEKTKKEHLLGLDIPVNVFISWCNELDDKDIPLRIPKI